jgi:hypothetical protein
MGRSAEWRTAGEGSESYYAFVTIDANLPYQHVLERRFLSRHPL